MIKEKYGRTSGSIMPYSYCYNRWCTGISEMDRLCIFEYIYDSDNDKTYKYLGEGYNYNGKVYHFPKSGSTKCIGEWLNGKYHKYENPIEVEGRVMFNIDLLKKYVAEYKSDFYNIRFGKDHNEIYKWQAVKCFQDNWNIDALNFSGMLKTSLSKTYNLLTASYFFAYDMISKFVDADPEKVRAMFRNLYDEDKDLAQRIIDFGERAKELNEGFPDSKKDYQNTRAASVYLWLKYPEKYYVYQWGIYDVNVKALNAAYDIKGDGTPDSMIEGFKFYDEIRKELAKDEELVKLHLENGIEGYDDRTLHTLTIDLGFYIYRRNEEWEPSLNAYFPRIDVAKWKELLENKEVFDNNSLKVVHRILAVGGQATCKQLAEKFGETYNFYNNVSIALAKRVQAITNCQLPPKRKDGTERIWPILYVGKEAKDEGAGVFIWKLRNELKEALIEIRLPIEDNTQSTGGEAMPKHPKNLILYGPPGTGKTYNTVNYAVAIIENKTIEEIAQEERRAILDRYNKYKNDGQIEFCTFHQSFGYEEFIEGIKPVVENGNVVYKVQDGVFKDFCEKEVSDVSVNKVFIIDEINRGNISKIFGELITLIEDTKRIGADEEMRARLPYSGKEFGVPNNVYLLGTMNTADRSIALIDTALRRRFKFVEMQPDVELLNGIEVEGVKIKELLEMINKRIEVLYDREHTIGHSFFMGLNNASTIADLAEVFECNVIPLLKEYFYNDFGRIAAVLGDNGKSPFNFFDEQDNVATCLKNSNIEVDVPTSYKFQKDALTKPEAYKKIYE
ncbi:MAG: AAA family ATPase [Phascolarctobacterium sp.]|nr:AAA family ATPase [Phascolarctobacterium sp.]